MQKQQSFMVVIPVYQPSNRFPSLVDEIQSSGFSVLIVDDGSGPDYEEIFRQLNEDAMVLHHLHNLGKGAALKTAFRFIRNSLPLVQAVITVDGDGQHCIEDINRMAHCLKQHPDRLVLGSRDFSFMPLRSKLGNSISSLIFTLIANTPIHDTQTGLRAFSFRHLDYMCEVKGQRYEYETNVLLQANKNNIDIFEMPIQTIYVDEKNSTSHFHPILDAFRIYRSVFGFISVSLISFITDYLLFLIFTILFNKAYLLCNILARMLSAALNYYLNAGVVFQTTRSYQQTLPKYAALAAFILLANSILLDIFISFFRLPASIAKIMTEMLMFTLSYFIQSKLIFRKERAYEIN